jgi:predicted nucleic acid-binding protein
VHPVTNAQECFKQLAALRAALQFDLALVTADYRDFEHLDGLTLIPVSA